MTDDTRKSKAFRYALMAFAVIAGIECLYFLSKIPSFLRMNEGTIDRSAFIERYESKRKADSKLPALKWNPKPITLSKKQLLPFIVAEDSRFYQHSGIDLQAIQDAISYNLKKRRFVVGASTISQQTVKNMFLTPSRNPVRKWHELILTLMMEALVSKKNILNTYLNVAEFGTGIYGINAAAHHYYGQPPSSLGRDQIVGLAATLPSPKKSNPRTQSRFFTKRKAKIHRTISRYYSPKPQPPSEGAPPVSKLVGLPLDGDEDLLPETDLDGIDIEEPNVSEVDTTDYDEIMFESELDDLGNPKGEDEEENHTPTPESESAEGEDQNPGSEKDDETPDD
ncbi:MAG: transglycosylase domain-containing protein [Pseudobacteriovorax sp.]|nr:transglycosylase domain-containing protein [Pseudobacteriovorax sp.]